MVHTHIIDKLGIALSALCAVHCALLPIAVLFFPILDPVTAGETPVHIAFAVLLLFVTILAFARGYQQHRRKDVVIYAGLGLMLVVGALLAPGRHDDNLFSMEAVLTTFGGALLIIGHIKNLHSMTCCKSKACSGHHHHEHPKHSPDGLKSEAAIANNLVF
ncbi:MAG: MerC domain-containing protein [Bdellovibrionales bacterium]|nr:MerC domain-containing protein [Bdellovibrionales bacterium]